MQGWAEPLTVTIGLWQVNVDIGNDGDTDGGVATGR